MSFVRPEARATLRRWAEAGIGLGVMALGLWLALGTGGILGWIGWAVALAGAAMSIAGVQRARFRRGSDGPGIVDVTEARISYFGPLTGGVAALDDLGALALDRNGRPAHWILQRSGEPDLFIPVSAEGADRLFDAFARLPGLRTERLLRALEDDRPGRVELWRRPGHAPVTAIGLH
ncbi:hypothetical protein [Litorisediminicola beolgyonensis]|uniref:Uncharacterized protein n=1 Tax=Litorisediminicola beolgyonensis TaxID=1173614 RepID=A0ABW3ZCW3_9RHOB